MQIQSLIFVATSPLRAPSVHTEDSRTAAGTSRRHARRVRAAEPAAQGHNCKHPPENVWLHGLERLCLLVHLQRGQQPHDAQSGSQQSQG